MTSIIKNIHTPLAVKSHFSRMLAGILLTIAMMIGGSGSAWAEFKDFSILVDNSANSLLTKEEIATQWTAFEFGIAVDNEGNVTRVAKDDASSVATISGKSHSDHGSANLKIVVPIDAPVKITVAQCQYSSSDIVVKNASGETVVSKTPDSDCWKSDHSNVSVLNYDGPATTLTIGEIPYCAYVSIERKFQNFELDFSTNGYTVLEPSSGLPYGVTIGGTFHDSQHGYNGFTASIPVPVGNYKITIGGCQYDTGTYSVSNGSSALTAITQPSTCFDKNDKSKNVASNIYEISEKTTLQITGPNYTPYFKIEKIEQVVNRYTVTYSLGSSDAIGVVPASVEYTEGDAGITIPKNFTLYKEGYTLTGWSDGTDTYAIGASYTPTADVTLTPVFTENTKSLSKRTSAVTLRWDFQKMNGAPSVSFEGEGSTGVWVTQATVAGETIDVKLDYDATSGKIFNGNWNDWCQMNSGTKFTIPSYKNAVVSIESNSFGNPATTTTTTIDGATDYTVSGQVVSKTISSSTNTIDVVIGNGQYFRYIQTVLPVREPLNFTIDLTKKEPTLPEGVTATNDGEHGPYYHTGGHGWANYVFKFTTSESVKITMQKCYYGANACVKDAVKGNVLGTLDTKQTESNCNGEVSWIYESDGTSKDLYVHCGDYCHGVKVEEIVETPESDGSTRFELDFTKTGDNRLISGELPGGASVEGTIHGDGSHGSTGVKVTFPVTKPSIITVGGCNYDNESDVATLKVSGETIASVKTKNVGCSGKAMFYYGGDEATLELTGGTYCNYVAVEPVTSEMDFDGNYSPYNAKVSDVHQLRKALAVANGTDRYKIFLANGTYDLETQFGTYVKDKVSLIGESRDGVIIQNTPAKEGIWTSSTLSTGSNVIIQNLTLKCTVTKEGGNERGTALYDNGSGNVYNNVRLLGRQDTYYSSDAAKSLFKNCEINGTVDFICGGGNVMFENCDLVVLTENSYITAACTSTSAKGYVFNGCTIKGDAALDGKFYLGRPWFTGGDQKGVPATTFINTTMEIKPYAVGWSNWLESGGTNQTRLHEYGSKDAENNAITLSERSVSNLGSASSSTTNDGNYVLTSTAGYTASDVIPSVTANTLSAPANVVLNEETNTLTWEAVDGASAYAVYYGSRIVAVVTGTTYTVESSAKVTSRRNALQEGKYNVAAISEDGIIGELSLLRTAPTITSNMYGAYDAYVGEEFQLAIAADDATSYQWYKSAQKGSGVEIAVEANKIEGATSATYVFTPSVAAIEYYCCVATNDIGSSMSRVTKLSTADRSSVQFIIDLTKNPVDELPAGVTQIGYSDHGVQFNGSQHGWCWYGVQFNVDGPVKITLGGCQYITAGYEGYVTDASGKKLGDIKNKTAACYDADGSCGTFEYKGGATTLKLYCGQYCPYVKVEKLPARTFTDFKIDFRNNPYTVVTPEAGLPTGVEVSQGGYNGGQHGATNTTITVPVDGPVKFTIGGCQYTDKATVSIDGGAAIDIDTKGAGCDNGFGTYTKFATYTYNVEAAATLTFNLGSFCPYFFAEACDYIAAQYDISFANAENTSFTNLPATSKVNEGESVTLPTNRKWYKDGYTLTKWKCGDTEYNLGATISDVRANMEFTPVFVKNETSIATRPAATTVTWAMNDNADFQASETQTVYVEQATINSKTIDVKLDVAGTFRTNNDWKAIGKGTTITVPVCQGAKITFASYYGMTVTIDGNSVSSTGSEHDNTITYTVADVRDNSVISFSGDGYIKNLSVEFPAKIESDLAIASASASKTLAVGDTYQITASDYTTSGTGAFSYASSNEALATVSADGVITAVAVSAEPVTITITQAADNTYSANSITMSLTVKAAEKPFLAIWDWNKNAPNGIGSATDNIASYVDGAANDTYTIKVEGGSIYNNNGNVGINNGTTLQIPVIAVGDLVDIKFYNSTYASYATINGAAVTTDRVLYSATATDKTRGFVSVKAELGTTYIFSIAVCHNPVESFTNFSSGDIKGLSAYKNYYIDGASDPEYATTSSKANYNAILYANAVNSDHGTQDTRVYIPIVRGTYDLVMGGCQFSNNGTCNLYTSDGSFTKVYSPANTTSCYDPSKTEANNSEGSKLTDKIAVTDKTWLVIVGDANTYLPYFSITKLQVPTIITQPVAEGQAVVGATGLALSVTVDAGDWDGWSYQWYESENADGTGTQTAISGATAASITYNSAEAGTKYVYCQLKNGENVVKSNISTITVMAARAFTDFTIDFRVKASEEQQYYVVKPDDHAKPSNFTPSPEVTWHDNQHGTQNPVFKVSVDGPVKFTIGTSAYGSNVEITGTDVNVKVNNNGTTDNGVTAIASATYTNYITYIYNEEASKELTFTFNGYLPFIKAEKINKATEYDVRYFDYDDSQIGNTVKVPEGSTYFISKSKTDCTKIPTGMNFRGWYNQARTEKIADGFTIEGNTNLYVRATTAELAVPGKTYKYNFLDNTFDFDVQDIIKQSGGSMHGSHGWEFKSSGGSISVYVPGNATLKFLRCMYSNTQDFTVTDADGNQVGETIHYVHERDASNNVIHPDETYTFEYTGPATWLSINYKTAGFVHSVEVENAPLPAAVWDWANNTPTGIQNDKYEGSSGYIESTVSGVKLFVDATSGKLAYNESNSAQFNTGTIIRVPVVSTTDVVNVKFAGNSGYCKIGGTAAANNDVNHTATAAEVAQGYVELTVTENSAYISSISVTLHPVDVSGPKLVSASPANGSTDQPKNGSIVLTFDRNVKLASGASATLGSTTLTNPVVSGNTITYNYSGEWSQDAIFTLAANSVTDVIGYALPYATTLSFTIKAKPEVTGNGWYDAVVENTDQLLAALETASGTSPYKIFVKNGTYNLGTVYDTPVRNYTTLVGESRDGVIIENYPEHEGIWSSATLRTGSNVIMQNLTLQSHAVMGSSVSSGGGTANDVRGAALYDNGSGNYYKNIRLLGRQDTYYSADATNSYFEDCEIHGAVDFICGSGNVWFEKCSLLIESSSVAYITAARRNNTSEGSYTGYTFNECTIDNASGASMNGKYYLGRAWDANAKVSYYKTNKVIAPNSGKWTAMSGGVHIVSVDSDDSPVSTPTRPVTSLDAPESISLSDVTLTWSEVTGASGYAVYQGTDLLGFTTSTSFNISASSEAKGRRNTQTVGDDQYAVAAIASNGLMGELKVLENAVPVITTNLQSAYSTVAGTAVELSIVATGATSYEWYKSTTEGTADEIAVEANKIADATTATYSFNPDVAGKTYICCVAINDNGSTKSAVAAVSARDTFRDFAMDFTGDSNPLVTNISTGGSQSNVRFAFDASGNIVRADENDLAPIDVTTYYHGTAYGLQMEDGSQISFWVDGPVKITMGMTDYSTNATIANSLNSETQTLGLKAEGKKYTTSNPVVATCIYTGEAAKITITGCKYLPYIKVERLRPFIGELDFTSGGNANAIASTWSTGGNATVSGISFEENSSLKEDVTKPVVAVNTYYNEGNGLWLYDKDNQHISFDVEGPVDIIFGTSNKDASVIIKNEKGEVVCGGAVNLKGGDYASDKTANVTNSCTYSGGPATLTISGTTGDIYIPYIKVGPANPRKFTDFKIDFRTDPYTVVTPEAGLPTGVEVSQGGYNGGQHGATNTTITVPVDGPVKFTIGGCTYTGGATVSINGGAAFGIDTQDAGCDNGFGTYTKFATYLYNFEEEATLTFNLGSYCPYFFAEACDYVPPVTITYYNTDGTTKLDEETVFGGSNLKYKDGVADRVTVPEGYKFRGWFSSTGDDATKVAEGTPVNADLNLYAKATPIETVTDGSEFEYILGHTNFYQEDHENITISGGSFHDTTHGWVFNGGTISVNVAKESYVILGLCAYSGGGDITATVNSEDLGVKIPCNVTVDGTLRYISYEGEENATMVINIPNGAQYIHSVKIVNRKYTKPITVTFENKNKSISGTVPDSQEADLNNKVTMPYGFTLYREGWSLTGWRDADGNVYNVGTEYTLVKDITVSPVMVQNEVAITDVTTAEEQTVQWNFGLSSNPYAAPVMKLEGEDGFYMKQTSIDGKPLDLRMDIKARNGKYDSSDSRVNALAGEGCQLNDGTVLTIPAVPGMTVTLKASAKNDTDYTTTTNFTGENCAKIQFGQPDAYVDATVVDATTVTYTYTGNASTLDVFVKKAGSGNTWGFFEYLEVKYPILPYITIVPVIDEDSLFANELPARAGEVGMTESPTTGLGKRYAPNDNVTIYAEAAYGYTVHGFKDSSDNDLTSGTYQVKNDNGEVIATLPSATYTIPEGDTKNNIIKVIYKRQTLYAVTTTVLGSTTPADGLQHGQITLSPKYDNLYVHNDDGTDTYYYTKGTEVTANSIADREYIVEQWSDDVEEKGNANSYTFTVGEADRAIKVRFRIGFEGTVTFNIAGSGVDVSTATFNGAISEAPATQTNVRSFYIPKFYTFFNNGHTLTHWKDASGVKYQLGQFYSFKEENQQLTLTPVFEGNIADKENRTRGDELYWDFRISEFAQTVDMDAANKNTFWTGKVDVEVIEGGQNRAHTRDVALWVHTGEEGYVRNSDMQDWAAFGPGTSFDLPSCAGATIKMLTYSEITSTTFDGHIPELDQQATDSLHALGERGYVYKYTTTNANARVTIVIGDDDYSYYKWIRCFTLPANMVNLHIDLDDKGRGQINSIATAVEGHDMKELEDGGVAFNKGERVCVEFQRKFGLEFSKVIDTDKGITVFELLEDGSARMIDMNDGYETVSVSRNTDGTYGRYDADNTSNNTSFYFDVPVDAGTYSGENDSLRTAYKLYFSMNNHRNLQICFKEISTYYVTYNAGRLAEGAAPASHWLEKGDTYTISPNNTLYYEGHTLKYWEDKNDDRYAPNTTYTLTEAQGKILYPVFEANTFSLVDIPDGLTATWNFSRIDGAPTFKYERSSGILVTQLKNGDDFIDLKLFLDATEIPGDGPNGWAYDSEGRVISGKISNADKTNTCQINKYSKITFPSTMGSTFSMVGAGLSHVDATSAESPDASATRTIEFKMEGSVWVSSFSVAYKKPETTTPELASLTYGSKSLTAEQLASLKQNKTITLTAEPYSNADESMPQVTATATYGGHVSVTQATILTREASVTLRTSENGILVEAYTIKFNFGSDPAAPVLTQCTVNSSTYSNPSGSVSVGNVPVSGSVTLTFNKTMAASTVTFNGKTLKAEQGRSLTFRYWDLEPNKDYDLVFAASSLKSIYNKAYPNAFTIKIHTSETVIPYEHRKFDYIVTGSKTLDDAISNANASASQSDRYYVFLPDGDYSLTGNENITLPTYTEGGSTEGFYGDKDGNQLRTDLSGKTFNNGMTRITRPNVSIIGQSHDGVTVHNHPTVEGISYTATIHLAPTATDFYAEDLVLKNDFDYWTCLKPDGNDAARAVVLWNQGNRSVLKNVSLDSWQDTYYSMTPENSELRGYFEDCNVYGVVDYLCGDGDIWFERTTFTMRDRDGNNIAAPRTLATQTWGYVMNNCVIKNETYTASREKTWTLARPWGNPGYESTFSPAMTLLNTRYHTMPRDVGYNTMHTGLVLRFHEYHSMNAAGTPISLGSRSLTPCTPAAGSDDCILSEEDAGNYTVQNVLGGGEAFDPRVYTKQIDAASGLESDKDPNNTETWNDGINILDGVLQWKTYNPALCYFVFYRASESDPWTYREHYASDDAQISIDLAEWQEGYYCVRAANQRGGLGAATKSLKYVPADVFELTLSKAKDSGKETDQGWSTICLPNNAKVPAAQTNGSEGNIKVYAAVSISGNTLTLKKVDYITANKGYVVYGTPGTYSFRSSSYTAMDTQGYTYNHDSYLDGNPSDSPLPASSVNCYTLAFKPNVSGIGFYKFAGASLKSRKAYLDVEVFKQYNTSDQDETDLINNASARGIRFVFAPEDDATDIPGILDLHSVTYGTSTIYDLSGRPVRTPLSGHIYIINGTKTLWE